MGDLLRDKRAVLALGLCLIIALNFWLGSRVPALNEKAVMGDTALLEDGLSFGALVSNQADNPFLLRVLYSTVNWVSTNKQGMTFGVLIAAALMTFISLFRRFNFGGRLANSLAGTVLGAPLGVCVNCAAPIACGVRSAGAPVETALAAMISSPMLNFIVLTMLFSLFPLHLAIAKVLMSFVVLLVLIPLITRHVPVDEGRLGKGVGKVHGMSKLPALLEEVDPVAPSTWSEAGKWLAKNYGRNLWFIARYTVPLMLLAGFLGALLVNALPWEKLVELLPAGLGVRMWLAMIALACVGIFLPVPIAFDVVVAAILSGAGLPLGYVMALLFTLGVFSVYSFFIVGRFMSWRLAAALALSLAAFGALGGAGAQYYHSWNSARQADLILNTFAKSDAPDPSPQSSMPYAKSVGASAPGIPKTAVWSRASIDLPPGIFVETKPFESRSPAGDRIFIRHYGEKFGLLRPNSDVFRGFEFRSLSAGDVNRDGWVDLIVATAEGPLMFLNVEGTAFNPEHVDVPELESLDTTLAVLVDLNNDGWLDMIVSGFHGGNHIVFNDAGRFQQSGYRAAPATTTPIVKSFGFGDLDRDGDLDTVVGNTTSTSHPWVPPESSRNTVIWNDYRKAGHVGFAADPLRAEPLPALPGRTLTTLVADLNFDGLLDVAVGNDYTVTDFFYMGTVGGELHLIERSDRMVPHTAWNTMSIDTGDINNDLVPEMYVGQITGTREGQWRNLITTPIKEVCDGHDDEDWRTFCRSRWAVRRKVAQAFRTGNATDCMELASAHDRDQCIAVALLTYATIKERDESLCGAFPPRWDSAAYRCRVAISDERRNKEDALRDMRRNGIPQVRGRNLLMFRESDGFVDRSKAWGVDVGGWTWNAKFADLDNDEWLDLYVANGMVFPRTHESNVFFHNDRGTGFVNETREFGLTHFFAAGSYVYIDFDNDGDLDIVVESEDGPVWIYENASQTGNAIVFEFNDEAGNVYGVGNKVIIHYGDEQSRRQVRELKAGGGYLSFDSYRVHFGLGSYESVGRVDVYWSTGETSTLRGDFRAGHTYRIGRSANVMNQPALGDSNPQ